MTRPTPKPPADTSWLHTRNTRTTEIETINDCMVGSVAGRVQISAPPIGPIDSERALRLAAWIVAIADPTGERFGKVLKAVLST